MGRCIVAARIAHMKNKIMLLLCALTFTFGGVSTSRADVDRSLDVVGDVALVRPGCILVTAVGSVIFVIALPFTVFSHSVGSSADTLIVHPAEDAFTRPVGDFTPLS